MLCGAMFFVKIRRIMRLKRIFFQENNNILYFIILILNENLKNKLVCYKSKNDKSSLKIMYRLPKELCSSVL